MIKEVGLYFNNTTNNSGPGKVATNLIKGLEMLGVDVKINTTTKYTGCLQTVPHDGDMLFGPNLFVLPQDVHPSFWERKRNLVVPCQWVKDKYKTQLGEKHNIHVWPVGIDTDKFVPSDKEPTNDCLIYFKRGSKESLQELISILEEKKLTHKLIEYGSYTEDEFIEAVQSSRFCVMLAGTESQGIAYLEIYSMNVPIYTLDKTVWDDRPGISFPATSAPYGDGRCGIKTSDGFACFDLFLNYVHSFRPREYILENFTLEKCASEYLSLLEKCDGDYDGI